MRKLFNLIYFLVMAVLVLSLSGCNGSSDSFSSTSSKPEVKQVAVLTSPVFQQGKDYQLYKGSLLNIDNAKYYIAPNIGSDSDKATLNLGFTEELDDSLVIVDDSTGNVVFAYDPAGNGSKTTGNVEYSGGQRLKYDGLTIAASFFSALNVDTASAKVIILDGDSATLDGSAVKSYNYVWHSDPNHKDEYYTEGLEGTEELTEEQVLANIAESVYIAHDIRYMTNELDFTGMVKNDDETEYAAYYSSEVQSEVAAELGGSLTGPYIFATLPRSMGMPGGGNFPGGMSGDNRPDLPGNFSGDNRPEPPSFRRSASYNDTIASTIASMTHSAQEAYNNPVLHITEPGVYSLQGRWNGQIWIEIGDSSSDKAALILNGVTVSCDVAPALVFKEVYECGPDDEDSAASDWKTLGAEVLDSAGAMVIIADDTVNNFTGSNVYRMLKPQAKKSSVTTIDGTDVSQQKKRYKMDGAFYSFVSLAMGGGEKANGILNVKSTSFEGLDAELHMTLESGIVTVDAVDDGMNFNEDDVSIFTMLGGTLTITSQTGDGIDSNGYAYINGGTLNITAGNQKANSAGEAGLDVEKDYEVTSNAVYNWTAYSGSNGGNQNQPDGNEQNNEQNNEQEQPSDSNTEGEAETITTSAGTTTIQINLGTNSAIIEDTDTSPRGIAESDKLFRIRRKVNTFSGITTEN